MPDSAPSADARRQGRTLACEGLLASQFGRRPCGAGDRALLQLRTEAGRDEAVTLVPASPPRPVRLAPPMDGDRGRGLPLSFERPTARPPWVWAAFAASLMLLLGGALFGLWWRGQPGLVLTEITGAGGVIEHNGTTLPALKGSRLHAGDELKTAAAGMVTLADGKRTATARLSEGSRLRVVATRRGPAIELILGRLETSPGRGGRRAGWEFSTPSAFVRGPGAAFVLESRPSSTWLAVRRGSVEFQRRDDGATARIGPQEYAVAARGLELAAHPAGERWQTPYRIAGPGS